MTITRDSVLFHFDAAFGERPVIGNLLTYERASAAYELGADNFYSKVVRDTPRIHTTRAQDSKIYTAMGLERAATQEVTAPFDISDPSWALIGDLTVGNQVRSAFEGQVAYNVNVGTNASNRFLASISPTVTSYQTAIAIFELMEEIRPRLAIRDEDTLTWVASVDIVLPQENIIAILNDGGTDLVYATRVLGQGPNGGTLWEFVVQGRATTGGSARKLWFYPDRNVSTAPYPIHYIGLSNTDFTPTPFEGTTTADFWKATGFSRQSHLFYISMVAQAQTEYIADEFGRYVVVGSDTSGIRIRTRGSQVGFNIQHLMASSNVAFIDLIIDNHPGDYVELMYIFDFETGRLTGRGYVNGVFIHGATSLFTPSSWPGDWGEDSVTFAAAPTGTGADSPAIEKAFALKLADAIPGFESMTTNDMNNAGKDAVDNLDILSSGRVF